jgi:hypothetical protein
VSLGIFSVVEKGKPIIFPVARAWDIEMSWWS